MREDQELEGGCTEAEVAKDGFMTAILQSIGSTAKNHSLFSNSKAKDIGEPLLPKSINEDDYK